LSSFFNKSVEYVVIIRSGWGGVAGGSYVQIYEPKQDSRNKNEIEEYEINNVQRFNPWNIGSFITNDVTPVLYDIISDHVLVVSFEVTTDISFHGSVSDCVKLGKYKATYNLDLTSKIYEFTDTKNPLIKTSCIARG